MDREFLEPASVDLIAQAWKHLWEDQILNSKGDKNHQLSDLTIQKNAQNARGGKFKKEKFTGHFCESAKKHFDLSLHYFPGKISSTGQDLWCCHTLQMVILQFLVKPPVLFYSINFNISSAQNKVNSILLARTTCEENPCIKRKAGYYRYTLIHF